MRRLLENYHNHHGNDNDHYDNDFGGARMTKTELTAAVAAVKDETRDALQELWDNINQGQRKQLAKKENIKTMLDRYGVSY